MKIGHRILTVGFPLLAIFVVGCGGGSSPPPPPPPPPPPAADTTAPTVSTVQAPAGTVNRIVTLTVTATDNVGVTDVRFFVDGVLLGNDATAPYSIDWDTSGETAQRRRDRGAHARRGPHCRRQGDCRGGLPRPGQQRRRRQPGGCASPYPHLRRPAPRPDDQTTAKLGQKTNRTIDP